jgi:putative phage-type endonuclease
MPKWLEYEQGSEDWLAARIGMLTASKVADAISCLKNGEPSQKSKDLVIDLIAERLSGNPTPMYVNSAMMWGLDNEPGARRSYEIATGNMVELCGLAYHDNIDTFGASPDGLIGDDGLIEIKCPETATHIEWVINGTVPEKHVPQMLAQLAVTGRKWCDFVSYDPRLPTGYNLFIRRFEPSPGEIEALEAQVFSFLGTVNYTMKKLTEVITNGNRI